MVVRLGTGERRVAHRGIRVGSDWVFGDAALSHYFRGTLTKSACVIVLNTTTQPSGGSSVQPSFAPAKDHMRFAYLATIPLTRQAPMPNG